MTLPEAQVLLSVTDLQGNPNYPASPDKVVQTKFIEYPAGSDAGAPPPGNVQDNYGIRISGLLTVDSAGDYVFAMSSDDGGEFWLGTDNTEAGLVMIAHEPTGIQSALTFPTPAAVVLPEPRKTSALLFI